MKVNLHTHSVKSDGVFTPEEVVKIQRDDGIEAMSLTDHDNVSGIDEAIRAGEKYGLKVLPGIELSCYSVCEIHILGYNFDYKNPDFVQDLENVKDLRRQRINKTVEKLHALNVPFDDSALDFENANLGRIHVAKEMVSKGLQNRCPTPFINTWAPAKKRTFRATDSARWTA
ncbi:MAG: PHP domain-containing protein [Clostridium sp.]|nr:MAG: PHP domain-containing protein [Clostridium sp.]